MLIYVEVEIINSWPQHPFTVIFIFHILQVLSFQISIYELKHLSHIFESSIHVLLTPKTKRIHWIIKKYIGYRYPII
jgi:hypothetical protein